MVAEKKKSGPKAKKADKKTQFIAIGDHGGNLPGKSPDAVGWDGDKTAAERADINKGLF